ncbi:hypothetical protein ACWD4J_15070 [Streptomyces sp. NPDC002577]
MTQSQVAVLPPVTRMLLESEGSTTVLLESLVGVQVELTVHGQEPVAAGGLADEVRRTLRVSDGERCVVRRSSLVVPGEEPISVNEVVFREGSVPWLTRSVEDAPIGRQLRGRGTLQFRTLLAHGLDRWPLSDAGAACAYKKYVIHCDDGAELYVHERFNPRYVPLSEAAPDAAPSRRK